MKQLQQELFELMEREHGRMLTQTEMFDILHVIRNHKPAFESFCVDYAECGLIGSVQQFKEATKELGAYWDKVDNVEQMLMRDEDD